MNEIRVSIFGESMIILGEDKHLLARYADECYLTWHMNEGKFFVNGKPTCLYKMLLKMSFDHVLIVD